MHKVINAFVKFRQGCLNFLVNILLYIKNGRALEQATQADLETSLSGNTQNPHRCLPAKPALGPALAGR